MSQKKDPKTYISTPTLASPLSAKPIWGNDNMLGNEEEFSIAYPASVKETLGEWIEFFEIQPHANYNNREQMSNICYKIINLLHAERMKITMGGSTEIEDDS